MLVEKLFQTIRRKFGCGRCLRPGPEHPAGVLVTGVVQAVMPVTRQGKVVHTVGGRCEEQPPPGLGRCYLMVPAGVVHVDGAARFRLTPSHGDVRAEAGASLADVAAAAAVSDPVAVSLVEIQIDVGAVAIGVDRGGTQGAVGGDG